VKERNKTQNAERKMQKERKKAKQFFKNLLHFSFYCAIIYMND